MALPDIVAEPVSPEPVTVVVTVAEPAAEPVVVVVVVVVVVAEPAISPLAVPAPVSSAFFFLQPATVNIETRAASRMNFFMGSIISSE